MAEEFDLRSDYAAAMQEIGQQFDHIDRSLNLHTQQIASLSKKLDEQETTLYEHGALLKEQGRSMRELKIRLATVETGVASLVLRQNSIDEKVDAMGEKLDALSADIKRIISLLSRNRIRTTNEDQRWHALWSSLVRGTLAVPPSHIPSPHVYHTGKGEQ